MVRKSLYPVIMIGCSAVLAVDAYLSPSVIEVFALWAFGFLMGAWVVAMGLSLSLKRRGDRLKAENDLLERQIIEDLERLQYRAVSE